MKFAAIRAIEYHLPERVLTTGQLAAEFPEWGVEKIEEMTGIGAWHIAAEGECASDLAVAAARKLFASGVCGPADIDYVLLCTQSPDYFLPTTACLIQDRLGIPTGSGALDVNLGSSGYVYCLGLAQGLIETGQASTVLLLTADTYSKFIHGRDKSVRTIFGDGAAATLVQAVEADGPRLGPYVYGTDGRGAGNLIVRAGGMRVARTEATAEAAPAEGGNWRAPDNLYMNGPEIFNFTLRAVPELVRDLLERAGRTADEVDCFVFHQPNRFMLEHLRKRLKIPAERFVVSLREGGNTATATIPIALKHAQREGKLRPGMLAMLVGFGGGYSWGAVLARM